MAVRARTARYVAPIVVVVALLLVASAPAYAGEVSVSGATIGFAAAPGEENDVRADPRPDGVLISDASAPLTAGAGCTAQPDGVLCAYPLDPAGTTVELRLLDGDDRGVIDDLTGLARTMRVLGGGGDDVAHVGSVDPGVAHADGGSGNDELSSAMNFAGVLTLTGGNGDDELHAREIGNSTLVRGGDGEDVIDFSELFGGPAPRLEGNDGRDTFLAPHGGTLPIEGGRGFDTLSFENVTLAAPEFDLETCPDCDLEKIVGSELGDILRGDDGSTQFVGGAGNDEIEPRGGFDVVSSGDGLDRINVAGDRRTDLVSCGADADEVTAERRDVVARTCEVVNR